jgi:hypothetical protein
LEDTSTASKITEILDLLSDGQWHEIREIKEKMKLKERRIQQIVAFLKEYDFILVEETKKAVKIEAAAREFLAQKASS